MRKASVLMAVRDEHPLFLDTAILSILEQDYDNFQFVIVDDGSVLPATRHRIATWAKRDARIHVVEKRPSGLADSLNVGVQHCTGKYVFRQDSDDWSHRSRLARQLRFLKQHSGVALLGTNVVLTNEAGKTLWVRTYPKAWSDIQDTFVKRNPFCHGSVVFRRDVFNSFGGYRKELGAAQDYDLFWRICDKHDCANIDVPLYYYRFHARSISATKRLEQQSVATAVRAARPELASTSEAAQKPTGCQIADHFLLAGRYRRAITCAAHACCRGPVAWKAWATLVRCILFPAIPPLRKYMFRL
jgi:glycosyltransferase involved in cell wall biosynthesis